MGRPQGRFPAVEVGRIHTVVAELDAGQGVVGMDRLGQARQRRHIPLVPEAQLDEGRDVGAVVDLDLLGADHAPAALRLDAAHGSVGAGVPVAHAVAMGHLEEAVLGRDRTDPHRLEQDVVARIAPHRETSPFM